MMKHILVNRNVAKQVSDILAKQIVDGDYKLGDYLPTEEVLCTTFNIGRSSVREALKSLESRGLVRKMQGRGVMVIDETIEATSGMLKMMLDYKNISLQDMVDFRIAMEIQLVELAAMKATEEDIAKMRDAIDMMRSEKLLFDDFARHDYLFHEAIAEASHNSISILIMKTLRPILYDQISYTIRHDFDLKRAVKFHEQIYEQVCNHQIKAAGRAMAEHLKETHRVINELNKR